MASAVPVSKSASAVQSEGIDLLLLFTVIGMVLFGLLMVYSASFIYAQERTGDGLIFIKKQLLFAGIGFGALVLAYRTDYRRWSQWAYPVLGIACALLLAVFIPGLGARVGGARRWLHLGSMGFQPAELAKFAVIIFAASLLDRKKDRLHGFTAGILSPLLLAMPALSMLMFEPDFGTTVMIVSVLFLMMFVAGVPKKYLFSALALAVAAGVFLALGTAYRRARVMTFIDPWHDPAGRGFQIIQSMLGLHNGSLFGAGLGNGKEKLFYLPEAHNDFIFAVIGEELGFAGIAAVVGAYLYFICRGFRIAWKCQIRRQDLFGTLLALGITLALGLQGFVNMAVVMGLVPTKGLTLPFISYGGSSVLVDLFAVGILLSIARGPLRAKTAPHGS